MKQLIIGLLTAVSIASTANAQCNSGDSYYQDCIRREITDNQRQMDYQLLEQQRQLQNQQWMQQEQQRQMMDQLRSQQEDLDSRFRR